MLRFCFLVVLCFSAQQEIDEIARMIGSIRARGAYRGASAPTEFKFEKIFDDVRCNDKDPLYSKKVGTYADCIRICSESLQCYYMAYWRQTRLCEITKTCFSKVGDGNNKIGLYRKITSCEERSTEQIGELVREFPSGILRPLHIPFEWQSLKGATTSSDFPNTNMYCNCISQSWRTCAIFVTPGTDEFKALQLRFAGKVDAELEPFYYDTPPPGMIESNEMLMYKRPNDQYLGNINAKHVYQEIKILDHDPALEFDPANPTTFPRCLNIQQCNAGTPGGQDPGLHRPFESGDHVWILRKDLPLLLEKKNVACVTLVGLRQLLVPEVMPADGIQIKEFRDPFNRRLPSGEHMMILERDYVLLHAFDDKALSFGICPEGTSILDLADFDAEAPPAGVNLLEPGAKPPRRRGGKGKKKKSDAGSSSAEAGSVADSGSMPSSDQTEEHLADFEDIFETDDEQKLKESVRYWDDSLLLPWVIFLSICFSLLYSLFKIPIAQDIYVELLQHDEI